MGLPNAATARKSGRCVTSPEAILYKGAPSPSMISALSSSKTEAKSTMPRPAAKAISSAIASRESSLRRKRS